jgi:uncharacterized repeat protein (TIGR03803 family)
MFQFRSTCIAWFLALAIPTFHLPAAEAAKHELVASFPTLPSRPSQGGVLTPGPDGFFWGTTERGGAYNAGIIYKMKADGSEWSTVAEFTLTGGSVPNGRLLSDGAGFFWGTTHSGGVANYGTIFKVDISNGTLTTLFNFDGGGSPGRAPESGLASDGAGNFWGTTTEGGANDFGTVFRINVATGEFTKVLDFSNNGAANKGRAAFAGLVNDGAGNLWGATNQGGVEDRGTIFKVNISSGVLTTVAEFAASTGRGAFPAADLVSDGAGFLWGTARRGGLRNRGTVFKIDLGTGGFSKVADFTDADGSEPRAPLASDGAGNFWGTTIGGGTSNRGTVFKVNATTGVLQTIAHFAPAGDNLTAYPHSGLVSDGLGNFLGTTYQGGVRAYGTIFRVNPADGMLTTLLDLGASADRGVGPEGGLAFDASGDLWGTTASGGIRENGTIYKVNPESGVLTTVIEFTGTSPGNKGAKPKARLVGDLAGNFWGTTWQGGAVGGYGTIFEIDPITEALTTVAEFTNNVGDVRGGLPAAELVADGVGSFWGTTMGGGTQGNGTIFKVDISSGVVTTVVNFTSSGETRGSQPEHKLESDGLGNFWGTTRFGGGAGTVFKVNTSTGVFTTVVDFANDEIDGGSPYCGLVSDGSGNLWGTTLSGGAHGAGILFKVNAATGELTTMADFPEVDVPPGYGNSIRPSDLVSDGAGNFWGASGVGGSANHGTIYTANASTGLLTTVMEFSGYGSLPNTGRGPSSDSLLRGHDGNFYGTTSSGGPGGGTIFRIRRGPTPGTLPATAVTRTEATLQGTLEPNGLLTTASFEWSTNPTLFGSSATSTFTDAGSVPGDATTPVPVSATLTGLAPGTTYYYRVRGVNTENDLPQNGRTFSFTTAMNTAPTVTLIGANPLTVEAAATYTDAGATANDLQDGVLVPSLTANTVVANLPGTYQVIWSATDSEGLTGSVTREVIVQDTTAPAVSGTFSPRTILVGMALPDYTTQAIATDFVGVVDLEQNPAPGTIVLSGPLTVTITASDAANHEGSISFTVEGRPSTPIYEEVASKGSGVFHAGTDPRIQAGAKRTVLGDPAISDTGDVAYLGQWKAPAISGPPRIPAQLGTGIFVNDVLLLKVGDLVPGAGTGTLPADATFKTLKHPVIDQGGRVAFLATIKGTGVTASSDGVVMSAGRIGELEVLAREGEVAPGTGGAVFKSFTNVGIQGTATGGTVFTATLASVPGAAPVNASNNTGAWWMPGGGLGVMKLISKGDVGFATGETIASFQVLQAISGSAGHGRGQHAGGEALIQAGLKTGATSRQALVKATLGTLETIAATGDTLGGTLLPSATWKTFNLPAASADGSDIAVLGTLTPGVAGVAKASSKAILVSDDAGETWEPIARVGTPTVVGNEVVFSAITDPVASNIGSAFFATIKGRGVTPGTNDAVWWKPSSGTLGMLAREGNQPPGAPIGARWKSFSSLAIAGGDTGPLFTGTLKSGLPAGANRISGKDDFGLYARDSFGTLRELLRENQPLSGKTVKTFSVLKAIAGSAGVTRSFNAKRQVAARVTYTDGGTAIVKIEIP